MELPKKGERASDSQLMEICHYFGLIELLEKIEKDRPIKPFSSDGCSKWFDSWQGISIYPSCFIHDLKYWAGYPFDRLEGEKLKREKVERLVADAELMIDVARLLGDHKMAEIMFHGVRIGGHPIFKLFFYSDLGKKADQSLQTRIKPRRPS